MVMPPVISLTGWRLLLQVFERALQCGFQTPNEVSLQLLMINKEEASPNYHVPVALLNPNFCFGAVMR